MKPEVTPDKRYLVVRGRLWRAANPRLPRAQKQKLTAELMSARRAVRAALRLQDARALTKARRRVNAAKVALGERGPVWWNDGSPDYTRFLAKNTPYARWYARRR